MLVSSLGNSKSRSNSSFFTVIVGNLFTPVIFFSWCSHVI